MLRAQCISASRLSLASFVATAAFLIAFDADLAWGEEVIFTTTTQIACDEFTWEGFDVVVDGAIVSIDCAHQFASLTIRNAGLVTHTPGQLAGMELTITGDLSIDSGSDLDASGLGHGPNAGPGAGGGCDTGPGGGAGHGGLGGHDGTGVASIGAVYGDVQDPAGPGSGGGVCANGGRGGGVIRLFVGGTADIDGVISADGQNGIVDGGGGSGGSVLLSCATLTGNGILRARGGSGGSGDGGGGAGGRVSIVAGDTSTFGGDVRADAGAGGGVAGVGGAGTAWIERTGLPGRLVVDNRGLISGRTEMQGDVAVAGDLVVTGGATIVHPAGSFLHLSVERDVVVTSTGAIDVGGVGFPVAAGPGAGADCDTGPGGGGGYGGAGGPGSGGQSGGAAYGSLIGPYQCGSGGGVCGEGGAGGGAVRITAGRTLVVDGAVRADGLDAVSGSTGGGGAGGSLHLQCIELKGMGVISAVGGDGQGGGGGGGGGRVALYRPCGMPETFVGSIAVDGGAGSTAGEAGSIFPLAPSAADCNNNTTPDECDIGGGTSADGNGNGVPDECELTLALSVDNLVGGGSAAFTVTGGVPDSQVIVLWSPADGRFDAALGPWCVAFWFDVPADDPRRRIVVRGLFDGAGMYQKSIDIPARFAGRMLRFQAAQSASCPGAAMSPVVEATIE